VRQKLLCVAGLASLLLGACVTINVYFPAGEVKAAADQVIDHTNALATHRAKERR